MWSAFFYGGLPLALLGFVIGARYGNMERYTAHYDEEAGRIEGHPIGRVIDPLARDNGSGDGSSGRFVPSRALLVAGSFLPSVCIIAFLWWATRFDPLLLGVAAVIFFGGSRVAFLGAERHARKGYSDYG